MVGERTGVGGIHEESLRVDDLVGVASLVGDDLENVGIAVPAAEGGETPVGGDGGDGTVVRVEGVICGALEMFGNDTAKENGEGLVGCGVGFDLVPGDEDEGVIHEVAVVQERCKPFPFPG